MSLRKFLRRVIPREIREPISKVTESLEDAVRPATDPIRKFVSKAIPKELKPFLSSGIAIATGAFGGPAGAFLRTAIIDAMLQKAMIDPDAEESTELGEVPQDKQKGSIVPGYYRSPYWMSYILENQE